MELQQRAAEEATLAMQQRQVSTSKQQPASQQPLQPALTRSSFFSPLLTCVA